MKRGIAILPSRNQDLSLTGLESEVLALMRGRKLDYAQIAALLSRSLVWVRRMACNALHKEQAACWNEITKQQAGGSTSLSVARGDIRMKGTR